VARARWVIDGDPLTAYQVTAIAAGSGSLTFYSDGSFTLVPDTGFTGQATFTYIANDGMSDSDEATVTITVGGS
jgi:hypothetical protein